MAHPENETFRHRYNMDGTFDSICSLCDLTIASANDVQQLFSFERSHDCYPVRLYEVASGTWPLYRSGVA